MVDKIKHIFIGLFVCRVGEEPDDQAYREEKQQQRVHQDRCVEVPGHHQLHGSWF
jgi:hypothetical protein